MPGSALLLCRWRALAIARAASVHLALLLELAGHASAHFAGHLIPHLAGSLAGTTAGPHAARARAALLSDRSPARPRAGTRSLLRRSTAHSLRTALGLLVWNAAELSALCSATHARHRLLESFALWRIACALWRAEPASSCPTRALHLLTHLHCFHESLHAFALMRTNLAALLAAAFTGPALIGRALCEATALLTGLWGLRGLRGLRALFAARTRPAISLRRIRIIHWRLRGTTRSLLFLCLRRRWRCGWWGIGGTRLARLRRVGLRSPRLNLAALTPLRRLLVLCRSGLRNFADRGAGEGRGGLQQHGAHGQRNGEPRLKNRLKLSWIHGIISLGAAARVGRSRTF